MPNDPLEDLPAASRREVITAVREALDIDEAAARDIVRASEPLWDALESAGGLVDMWGGGEFCVLLPRMLAAVRQTDDPGVHEDVRVLSFGAVLGDSDALSRRWGAALGELNRRAESAQVGVASPLRLYVAFHLDGRVAPNEFTGVRTGRRDAQGWLSVQVALVPGEGRDPHKVLTQGLRDALDAAEAFARRNKVATELPELREVLERISSDPTARY